MPALWRLAGLLPTLAWQDRQTRVLLSIRADLAWPTLGGHRRTSYCGLPRKTWSRMSRGRLVSRRALSASCVYISLTIDGIRRVHSPSTSQSSSWLLARSTRST